MNLLSEQLSELMNTMNGQSADSASVFNIKAVVTQTGLNPATIRAWERRYGFPSPNRTAGGHRQYSQRDIDTLKWLSARQEEGVSISHAVDLWRTYVDRGEDPLQVSTAVLSDPGPLVIHALEGEQIDQLRQIWVTACLNFDRVAAEQVLASAFALFNPMTVCVELLQKGLAEVGNFWYEGEVSVQREHFASALSVQRLEILIAASPAPTRPERIVVATAPGDYHIFSPLLLTYMLRQSGWDVIYLGANVPANELASTIEHVQPDLIIVAAQLLHTAATMKEMAIVSSTHGVPLAFGGLVFNQMPELRGLIPGYFLGESMVEAVQWVSESLSQQLPPSQLQEPSEIYQRALKQFRERRAMIESHIWGTFIATNKPTGDLTAINEDIARTIEAALKLGDAGLLQDDMAWIEHLLMGYRLPSSLIFDYVLAYYQAARIHLGESASLVVDWLAHLVSE